VNMRNALYALAAFLLAFDAAAQTERAELAAVQDAAQDGTARDSAAAAFEAIVPVLRHPRCMNCHSAGDFPRQGNDSHQHTMQVRRGPDGRGVNSVQCSTCHQDHNLAGAHMPPGSPDWRLPPPETPMIWKGLTDGQLCELLKDPKQNGHRSVQQIVEHMTTPLVLWGWNPGEGRTPIPMKLSEFQARVRDWAGAGAACPVGTSAPGDQ